MSRLSMMSAPCQWLISGVCQTEDSLRNFLSCPYFAPASPCRPFPILLGALAATSWYAARLSVEAVQTCIKTRQNNKKRKKKQEACKKSIEDLKKTLETHPMKRAQVERITTMTLLELTGHLRARTLRPLQVLRAFQIKALEAHEKTNCLVEVINEAEDWARALEKGPRDGMLYGIPISIKDDVPIKGYDCTLGCIELADRPVQDDTCVIKVLRGKHGAIPFVKTNVPQTELTFEPGNPINGPVYNPHNTACGPGGSSSGEGALIAAGASVLGIGSDVGGSICVPSHFCGVCGFKPTHQRVSRLGSLDSPTFQSPIRPAYGPLARDVDSLVFAMKALWDGSLSNLDIASTPMPFNSLVYEDKSKLRIGYYLHDGMFPLFHGCSRAVLMAKAALEQKGHEVVAWTPPDISQALELYCRILQADSGKSTMKALECDLIAPSLRPILYIHKVPRFLRWLFAKVMWSFIPTLSTMVECTLGQPDVHSYWRVCQQQDKYCQMVFESWKESKLDAVICPPFAFAAPPLGNPFLSTQGATFGIVYNCLNFPSGVVRMTKVNQEDIDSLKDFPSDNPFHRAAKNAMEKAEGLPLGVMVASLRYQDEKCLRVMKDIETAAEFTVV